MNLLEKVGDFIAKRGEDIHQQISGKRVFSAHITNATKRVLEVQGKPMVSYGRPEQPRLGQNENSKQSFMRDHTPPVEVQSLLEASSRGGRHHQV